MKTLFKIFCLLHIGLLSFAQNKLNDPSIVAQHKRMVFEKWGDWRPYPKYSFLGIQTNLAYGTIWGSGNFIAPKRNVAYRKGADIRPLRVGGKEMLRQAETQLQQKQVKKIAVSVDSIYSRNVADFAHWTHLTSDADPLWLLYYKRKLRPLIEYPDSVWQDGKFIYWTIKNEKLASAFVRDREDKRMDRMLEIMKNDLDIARETNMPRGKRMLLYHRILKQWRFWERKYSKLLSPNNGLAKLLQYRKDFIDARVDMKRDKNFDNWEFQDEWFYEADKKIIEESMKNVEETLRMLEILEPEKYKYYNDRNKNIIVE